VVHTGKLWVKILNVGGYLGSRSSSFLNIYDFLIILSCKNNCVCCKQ